MGGTVGVLTTGVGVGAGVLTTGAGADVVGTGVGAACHDNTHERGEILGKVSKYTSHMIVSSVSMIVRMRWEASGVMSVCCVRTEHTALETMHTMKSPSFTPLTPKTASSARIFPWWINF